MKAPRYDENVILKNKQMCWYFLQTTRLKDKAEQQMKMEGLRSTVIKCDTVEISALSLPHPVSQSVSKQWHGRTCMKRLVPY